MTRKMDGYVCDGCRKVISIEWCVTRKSKKGRTLHFCDGDCDPWRPPTGKVISSKPIKPKGAPDDQGE